MGYKLRVSRRGAGRGRGTGSQRTQFKKGRSGNLRGRPPKKPANLDAVAGIADALSLMREVNTKDGVRKMTAIDLFCERIVAMFSKGTHYELMRLAEFLKKFGVFEELDKRSWDARQSANDDGDGWTEEQRARIEELEDKYLVRPGRQSGSDGDEEPDPMDPFGVDPISNDAQSLDDWDEPPPKSNRKTKSELLGKK